MENENEQLIEKIKEVSFLPPEGKNKPIKGQQEDI